MKLNETREITAVLLNASNNFNVYVHLDIYKLTWFKLGIRLVTVELCILILVLMTLTFISGHGNVRESEHFKAIYLKKFSIDSVSTWHRVETCWSVSNEPHTHFMLPDQYSREKTLLV